MQGPEPHTPSQNFSACTQLGPKLASTLTIEACQQDKCTALHENTCGMQIIVHASFWTFKSALKKARWHKRIQIIFPKCTQGLNQGGTIPRGGEQD